MYGIWRVKEPTLDDPAITMGAALLRRGGTVAFPTETVYGLGANALDPLAVMGIFHAKARPLSDPLIVHIAHRRQLFQIARDIPPLALKLAKAFWPGPLTLILKKAEHIPLEVTAGGDTVGVRIPQHPVARALLRASGVPVAAPSANRFTRPSATTAKHVADDLVERVSAILDGGACGVGIESTIVKVEGDQLRILRPGGISKEALEKHAATVIYQGFQVADEAQAAIAPGQMLKHYSPNALLIAVDGAVQAATLWMVERAKAEAAEGKKVGLILGEGAQSAFEGGDYQIVCLKEESTSETLAHELYKALRNLESHGVDVILTRMPEALGLGLGLRDRLFRAAEGHIVKVG